jgi:hypothetical protein
MGFGPEDRRRPRRQRFWQPRANDSWWFLEFALLLRA